MTDRIEPFPNSASSKSSSQEELARGFFQGSSNSLLKSGSPSYGSTLNEGTEDEPPLRRSRSLTESISVSMIYATNATIRQIQRQRFVSVCIFGCLIMILFNLTFLPRTSLDRDLRRLHGEFLTFDDCSRLFLTHLNFKNNAKPFMELMQEDMHIPGENVEQLEEFFKSTFKFKTFTDKYETWMNKPVDSYLRLVDSDGNVVYNAHLKESELLSFHPYSANGTVAAQYVFANYGTESDFDALNQSSVDVFDKIAIIRAGVLHTSKKIQNAQENGASAVLIYSDPYDDGHFTEKNGFESFPTGRARNAGSVEKETANQIYEQPGDPTTPGWSSTLFSHRVKAESIPKIPSLPISYEAIEPILQKITAGPDLGWKGNLDFLYSPGPSADDQILELGNIVQFKIKPIYNIVNEISGVIKDEEIIIGASRDTIGGLGGATSGHVALMELARGLNELVKLGWKPLRTIKLISWDGSSYGYLGSTEFGEFYANKLSNNAIVYINLDKIEGSVMNVEANPLFNNMIKRVMKQVMFDEKITLSDYFNDHNSSINLISNGMGDFSVFQNHLGIPSLNIGFSSNPATDPVPYQNSKFDSIEWYEMLDSKFKYPNLISQFVGLLTLNLSEREILHVKTRDYIACIQDSFKKLASQVPDYWLKWIYDDNTNTRIEQQLNRVKDTIESLKVKSTGFDRNLDFLQEEIIQDYPWFKMFNKIKTAIHVKVANLKIRSFDRMFLSEGSSSTEGILTGRNWFKHQVFAPRITGEHGSELLPGLQESVESQDFKLFVQNLNSLCQSLGKLDAKLL